MYVLSLFCGMCAKVNQFACMHDMRSSAVSYRNGVWTIQKYLVHVSMTESVRNSISALNWLHISYYFANSWISCSPTEMSQNENIWLCQLVLPLDTIWSIFLLCSPLLYRIFIWPHSCHRTIQNILHQFLKFNSYISLIMSLQL